MVRGWERASCESDVAIRGNHDAPPAVVERRLPCVVQVEPEGQVMRIGLPRGRDPEASLDRRLLQLAQQRVRALFEHGRDQAFTLFSRRPRVDGELHLGVRARCDVAHVHGKRRDLELLLVGLRLRRRRPEHAGRDSSRNQRPRCLPHEISFCVLRTSACDRCSCHEVTPDRPFRSTGRPSQAHARAISWRQTGHGERCPRDLGVEQDDAKGGDVRGPQRALFHC